MVHFIAPAQREGEVVEGGADLNGFVRPIHVLVVFVGVLPIQVGPGFFHVVGRLGMLLEFNYTHPRVERDVVGDVLGRECVLIDVRRESSKTFLARFVLYVGVGLRASFTASLYLCSRGTVNAF